MNEEKDNNTNNINSPRNNLYHQSYNPNANRNEDLEKALQKRNSDINKTLPHNNQSMSSSSSDNDLDDEESDLENEGSASGNDNFDANSNLEPENVEIEARDQKEAPGVSGVVYTVMGLKPRIWLWIILSGSLLFFFLLIIIIAFLAKNSDNLNYASSYIESEEYTKIYNEVEKVVSSYQSKYGVTVDKYLILSALTAYQGNELYVDDTDSDFYSDITVETEEEDSSGNLITGTASTTKMEAYVEILAKYQIVTTTSCSYSSSTMREIASNDDSVSIFNFLSSAAAREKNYNCTGSSTSKSYSLSNEEGNIDDDDSGSAFYWNLIDEDFLREYYSEYFGELSDELYEETAADTVEYIYLYAETLKNYDTTGSTVGTCNGTYYWWPIGSNSTTTSDGVTMASGDPVSSTIIETFDNHGALDIVASGTVYIIAAKAGTVVYPTDKSTQISYEQDLIDADNEYGNYVIIEHTDGTYTLYAHLAKDTITVEAGDTVSQGQVIGKMGNSGNATEQMLHFEVRVGGNSLNYRVDPEDYVSQDDSRPGCGDFSLTTTSLSETEFVSLMNAYCTSSGSSYFCNNFAAHASEVYQVSVSNNVNPELVVVTAGKECGWNDAKGGGSYNYWGIGVPNGASSGASYSSLADGIKGYASTIAAYLEGGSKASMITSRYNEREAAGCDSAGHGLPGTLAGMQSVYSWIGDYRYNPGGSGKGGCYYLNIIYGSNYCSTVTTCTNYSSCTSSSATTVCEQNDYTAYQISGKVELRETIFNL